MDSAALERLLVPVHLSREVWGAYFVGMAGDSLFALSSRALEKYAALRGIALFNLLHAKSVPGVRIAPCSPLCRAAGALVGAVTHMAINLDPRRICWPLACNGLQVCGMSLFLVFSTSYLGIHACPDKSENVMRRHSPRFLRSGGPFCLNVGVAHAPLVVRSCPRAWGNLDHSFCGLSAPERLCR